MVTFDKQKPSVKDTECHPARDARIERDTAPSTWLLVKWKIRGHEQSPVLEKSVTTAPQNVKDPDFDCCLDSRLLSAP